MPVTSPTSRQEPLFKLLDGKTVRHSCNIICNLLTGILRSTKALSVLQVIVKEHADQIINFRFFLLGGGVQINVIKEEVPEQISCLSDEGTHGHLVPAKAGVHNILDHHSNPLLPGSTQYF